MSLFDKPTTVDHRGGSGGGTQRRYEFDNGYGASVICHPYSYGGDGGLWELGVTKGGHLTYDTPITDDVIGHLTVAQVNKLLKQIKELA